MSQARIDAMLAKTKDAASKGEYELFKTTTHFDAEVGREQHGYPPRDEMPL